MLVDGDPTRLKQVVVNLLDNAIRYTAEGGNISLTAACKNGWATLAVADDGSGIPADALPHVFERFYRADKARSRYSGGSGLGLSIVKAICTAHRGEIDIASTEGVGTMVTIRLPPSKNETPVDADFSRRLLSSTSATDGLSHSGKLKETHSF